MSKSKKINELFKELMQTDGEIIADVSPKSLGGQSLYDAKMVTSKNVKAYYSDPQLVKDCCTKFEALGFQILREGKVTVSIKGPKALFEKVFKQKFNQEKMELYENLDKDSKVSLKADCYTVANAKEPSMIEVPKELSDLVEGISLPTPHQFFLLPPGLNPSALPPVVDYFHLNVPADVSLLLNADKAHQLEVTGSHIKVAMVDTGHYAHPFFINRGYHVDEVVLSPDSIFSDPLEDLHGHGTMESANIFAAAPDAILVPVKTNLWYPNGAFQAAMDKQPHIISNSWGRNLPTPPYQFLPFNELPLAASIAEAVADGIVVCFSAGNGQISWPAMHPDVIAVGGVTADNDMNLQASDYSSSFTTPIYPGRTVPDVCGLVGEQPRGIYIMLPGQPGCLIDLFLSGGNFPIGDQTQSDDGWACISGTSASCPQIAGICALMLQVCPDLTPSQVKKILQLTAKDVAAGNTNPFADQPAGIHQAGAGWDLATGFGIADAAAAVVETMARCNNS